MRMIAFAMALWAGLTAAFAGDGFVVDMETEDIRRLDGRKYLSDIAVGETTEVSILRGCIREGRLLIEQRTEQRERPTAATRIQATRESDAEVSLQIVATDRASPERIRSAAARFGFFDCKDMAGFALFGPTYTVTKINGATSFTDLLKTPPFAGVVMN
ncbi:hypothetical protein [Aliiroseovarius crassostreae]|uniref:hypothetical protein n=1 Tax=Aliiroseovarius crassostreae TaxID=154981 RepID=UPI003C7AFFDB